MTSAAQHRHAYTLGHLSLSLSRSPSLLGEEWKVTTNKMSFMEDLQKILSAETVDNRQNETIVGVRPSFINRAFLCLVPHLLLSNGYLKSVVAGRNASPF